MFALGNILPDADVAAIRQAHTRPAYMQKPPGFPQDMHLMPARTYPGRQLSLLRMLAHLWQRITHHPVPLTIDPLELPYRIQKGDQEGNMIEEGLQDLFLLA